MKTVTIEHGKDYPTAFIAHLEELKLHLCLFNRATYSRCKALIEELSKYPNIKLTLICSSSLLMGDYGKAIDYIRRDHRNCHIETIDEMPQNPTGTGSAMLVGKLMIALSGYFSTTKPNAVIVVADRFETWAPALVARCHNIPIVHIQGGEITGNIDDVIRHSITQVADYHFVSTYAAKTYLIEMGQEPKRVYLTGCPSLDVIARNKIFRRWGKGKYIISIFHPETNLVEKAYEQTKIVMEAVIEYCILNDYKCYWYYPNPDPGRMEIVRYLDSVLSEYSKHIVKAINLEPEQFLRQLAQCRLIIGNSSCGIRESSRLGVPSINVGDRQLLRERSNNVMDVGYDKDKIFRLLKKQHDMEKYTPSNLYGSGQSTKRMAEYLARMNYSLKGPLTYPLQAKFKEQHFGITRFEINERGR